MEPSKCDEQQQPEPEPVYLDLATESEDPSVTQIETVCFNCMEKGTTRLLLTLIPHFREVMISSFSCPHCNHSNSSLLNTGVIQDMGVKLALVVQTQSDLRRMIVKSDYASIKIPEVELEVPGGGEKGEITSVEGVISKVCEGLRLDQEHRRIQDSELADQIEAFITKLTDLMNLTQPFTIEINDPTGNSHIERLGSNGLRDSQVTSQLYRRTDSTNEMLALVKNAGADKDPLEQIIEGQEQEETTPHTDEVSKESSDATGGTKENAEEEEEEEEEEEVNARAEVMRFSSLCEQCHKPASTHMKLTDIPHFKEVVVMGTTCDSCGHRTSEVKSGGGISATGRRIELTMTEPQLDLARDVLKSETCSIEIPSLELHVGAGILGGKFTTLEGLLINIKEDLAKNPFFTGDSVEPSRKDTIKKIFANLDKMAAGELLVKVVLDDPAGNSYLQNIYAPDPDPNMSITDYERTFDQNEDLGLNDMKTEGYQAIDEEDEPEDK